MAGRVRQLLDATTSPASGRARPCWGRCLARCRRRRWPAAPAQDRQFGGWRDSGSGRSRRRHRQPPPHRGAPRMGTAPSALNTKAIRLLVLALLAVLVAAVLTPAAGARRPAAGG